MSYSRPRTATFTEVDVKPKSNTALYVVIIIAILVVVWFIFWEMKKSKEKKDPVQRLRDYVGDKVKVKCPGVSATGEAFASNMIANDINATIDARVAGIVCPPSGSSPAVPPVIPPIVPPPSGYYNY
jgi:hypothetical protein